MGFETQGQKYPEKETEEIEKTRERVDDLRKTDDRYTDSIEELAYEENEYREELGEAGADEKKPGSLADKYSTKHLMALEAEKRGKLDTLTGLENRGAMDQAMEKILNSDNRLGKNCSFLMLDLDYFKKVNDEFGHGIGDLVLKKLADIIKETIRVSDYAFRYGGEEFSIILPETELDNAVEVGERIKKAVEEAIIKFEHQEEEKEMKKTVSIGVASTSQIADWQSLKEVSKTNFDDKLKRIGEELIKKADRALYVAKNEGKNRVVPFDEKISELEEK